MSYRNDIDALAARHDALAAEVATKTKELDAARQLLDDAQQRMKLPVLPNIRVASPCSADWAKMTGDARVRACADCNKNVYNISEMTRDEAEALILAKEGRLCVRYYQRKDGTILLKDCVIGVAQKRKRRLIAAGAAALLVGGGAAAYKLTRPGAPAEAMMGDVAVDHEAEAVPVQGGVANDPPPPQPEPEPQPQEEVEVMGKMVPVDVVMGDML
ncbi:MAG TPA: hypothetical protein VIV11_28640 [Kofleriaceae bacterium]